MISRHGKRGTHNDRYRETERQREREKIQTVREK